MHGAPSTVHGTCQLAVFKYHPRDDIALVSSASAIPALRNNEQTTSRLNVTSLAISYNCVFPSTIARTCESYIGRAAGSMLSCPEGGGGEPWVR